MNRLQAAKAVQESTRRQITLRRARSPAWAACCPRDRPVSNHRRSPLLPYRSARPPPPHRHQTEPARAPGRQARPPAPARAADGSAMDTLTLLAVAVVRLRRRRARALRPVLHRTLRRAKLPAPAHAPPTAPARHPHPPAGAAAHLRGARCARLLRAPRPRARAAVCAAARRPRLGRAGERGVGLGRVGGRVLCSGVYSRCWWI